MQAVAVPQSRQGAPTFRDAAPSTDTAREKTPAGTRISTVAAASRMSAPSAEPASPPGTLGSPARVAQLDRATAF